MMHNFNWRWCAGLMLAGGLLSVAATGSAATAPAPAVVEEDVCVPKAIEEKVTACPEGANKFRVVARAKVGTTTRVEESARCWWTS